MRLVGLDWIIIAIYGAIMLAAGIYFSRRASRSVTDFFISGRSLPWWVAGTSMVATTFAADTPLLVTAYVRSSTAGANWIWFNFAISHALMTFFLAALWRRARVITDVEVCELRYSGGAGRGLRLFKGAFFAFVSNSVVLGWVILAMATICEEVLGFPKLATIGASLILATLYASLSGLWGVVATDLLQFAVAMSGAIILMIKALQSVGGVTGLAPLLPSLLAENGRPAMNILPDVFSGAATRGAIGGFLVAVCFQWWAWKYSDGGGVLVQRMSAARNERHATLAMLWFTVANTALRPWPWIMVALISLLVFPTLTDHQAAYPRMMAHFLGPGLLGLMMASILAAFMSTIDTHINLASSYFVNDLYRRFLHRGASERHYVWSARLASFMFLCIGALIAVFSTSIIRLFEFMLQLVAGAGAVFLLRWFWWRLNAWSEISAMVASLTIATLLNLANAGNWFGRSFASWEIILGNILLSAAVWLMVTFRTRPTEPGHLRAFYDRVRPPGLWGPFKTASARAAVAAAEFPARVWSPHRRLECFLLTIVLVYTLLIGIGQLLYARWFWGLALCAIGGLAAARIVSNLRPSQSQGSLTATGS